MISDESPAWCIPKRGDCALHQGSTRSFRFSRITATRVVSPTFDYPPPTQYEPSRIFNDCIGVWAGAGEATEVVVKFHPKWANHLKHHKWHHSQTTLRTEKDGSTVIRLFVKLCPELHQWVLSFADEAEVIRPPKLRQKVAERMAAAAEKVGQRKRILNTSPKLQSMSMAYTA